MDMAEQHGWTLADVVIRDALLSDYQAVCDIHGDIYAGMDYIPASYINLFHSKRYLMYIAEVRGFAVGFIYNFIIERTNDSVLLLSGAARTRPDCQGKGIMGKMSEHMLNKARKRFSKVRMVTVTAPNPNIMASVREGSMEILQSWCVYRFDTDRQHLVNFLGSETEFTNYTTGFSILRPHHASLFIDKNYNEIKKLIACSGNFLVYGGNWLCFPVSKESLLDACIQQNLVYSFENQNQSLVGISIFSICACKHGERGDLFYYGSSTPDLMKHLQYQCKRWLEVSYEKSTGLLVHVQGSLEGPVLEGRLVEVFGPRYGSLSTAQCLVEIKN